MIFACLLKHVPWDTRCFAYGLLNCEKKGKCCNLVIHDCINSPFHPNSALPPDSKPTEHESRPPFLFSSSLFLLNLIILNYSHLFYNAIPNYRARTVGRNSRCITICQAYTPSAVSPPPPTSCTGTPPPSKNFFNLSFSSLSSRINLSIGFSLTTALFLIFFARSAYLKEHAQVVHNVHLRGLVGIISH